VPLWRFERQLGSGERHGVCGGSEVGDGEDCGLRDSCHEVYFVLFLWGEARWMQGEGWVNGEGIILRIFETEVYISLIIIYTSKINFRYYMTLRGGAWILQHQSGNEWARQVSYNNNQCVNYKHGKRE